MFSTILAGLGMDEAGFLQDIDRDVLATTLAHVPAVVQFNGNVVAAQVSDTRRWLFGAALAWIVGFAMMLAANDGIFFPNKLYKYTSPGVIRAGEAENIFDKYGEIVSYQLMTKSITTEEMGKMLGDFKVNRAKPVTVEWPASRGTVYFEKVENGRRRFELDHAEHVDAPGNRILQYLGAIVLFSGFVGLFLEWRLRRLKKIASK